MVDEYYMSTGPSSVDYMCVVHNENCDDLPSSKFHLGFHHDKNCALNTAKALYPNSAIRGCHLCFGEIEAMDE